MSSNFQSISLDAPTPYTVPIGGIPIVIYSNRNKNVEEATFIFTVFRNGNVGVLKFIFLVDTRVVYTIVLPNNTVPLMASQSFAFSTNELSGGCHEHLFVVVESSNVADVTPTTVTLQGLGLTYSVCPRERKHKEKECREGDASY